jgi:hypothetical protein
MQLADCTEFTIQEANSVVISVIFGILGLWVADC